MFLFRPAIFVGWLGYPSTGDFFHQVFSRKEVDWPGFRAPGPKTLNTQMFKAQSGTESTQFRNRMEPLRVWAEETGLFSELMTAQDEKIPASQLGIRAEWPSFFHCLKRSGACNSVAERGLALLGQFSALLDEMSGQEPAARYYPLLESPWLAAVMAKLGKTELLAELRLSTDNLDTEPRLIELLHYLNLYLFLEVLAALDAENSLEQDPAARHSMFHNLLPTAPLQDWHPHKTGIMDIYLRNFSTREAGYVACTRMLDKSDGKDHTDGVKAALMSFFAGKRTVTWQTARKWLEGMLLSFKETAPDMSGDVEATLFLTQQKWMVADILCGWMGALAGKHKRLQPGDKGYFEQLLLKTENGLQPLFDEQALVGCFDCYLALYGEALGRCQAQEKNLEAICPQVD